MRVVITLSNQTKEKAEKQACKLGYPSLAALLKVTATLLAGRAAAEPEGSNTIASPAALGKLPHPDQFREWPPYITPNVAVTDPDLYAFYIQTGIIR
ncbi:MAG TPA: hypothetical protein VMR98_01405 [Candidatus Polarisedimenticolaceae bacterium]|nr:hypothetical protein [Candidatus Polarisedimenticolaceae bacterium]